MSLTEKDVRHAAKLAALKLTDEEVADRSKELSAVLDYVARLSSLSTRGVLPTSHVHGVVNAFRDDMIQDSLPIDVVEKIAPDFQNGSFRVPRIIG